MRGGLNRPLAPAEGELALIVGDMDVTASAELTPARVVYRPSAVPLPEGKTDVVVYRRVSAFYRVDFESERGTPLWSAVVARSARLYEAPVSLIAKASAGAIRWRVSALGATGAFSNAVYGAW